MSTLSKAPRSKAAGFTLIELVVATAISLVVLTGLFQFYISTSVNLQSAYTELTTIQENREAAQLLKRDAKGSDYVLAYADVNSLQYADTPELLAGERGGVAIFVQQDPNANLLGGVADVFETAVAYYIIEDNAQNSSLARIEVAYSDLQGGETLAQMVGRKIRGELSEGRIITENFEGALNGDPFYMFSDSSLLVNATVGQGFGQSQFSKSVNLTLNVSSI